MKKIFKKLFSIDRIDLIKKNLNINNSSILEIGVHRGEFSRQLYNNFKPQKLVLVDPWIAFDDPVYKNSWYGNSDDLGQKKQDLYYSEIKKNFMKEISEKKVEIHRVLSDEYFKKKNNMFDLIYIDGNHLFDFVKKDIYNSLQVLNKNGIIVLDDYRLKGWWNDGVTKAVKYSIKNYGIKVLERHNYFKYHHQCILQKI